MLHCIPPGRTLSASASASSLRCIIPVISSVSRCLSSLSYHLPPPPAPSKLTNSTPIPILAHDSLIPFAYSTPLCCHSFPLFSPYLLSFSLCITSFSRFAIIHPRYHTLSYNKKKATTTTTKSVKEQQQPITNNKKKVTCTFKFPRAIRWIEVWRRRRRNLVGSTPNAKFKSKKYNVGVSNALPPRSSCQQEGSQSHHDSYSCACQLVESPPSCANWHVTTPSIPCTRARSGSLFCYVTNFIFTMAIGNALCVWGELEGAGRWSSIHPYPSSPEGSLCQTRSVLQF